MSKLVPAPLPHLPLQPSLLPYFCLFDSSPPEIVWLFWTWSVLEKELELVQVTQFLGKEQRPGEE